MATLDILAGRLRAELGDTGRSISETFTGDGITTRFKLSEAPVDGATLVIKVNGSDVSVDASIEEATGLLVLDTAPANNAVIVVTGTAYRYFTSEETCYYISTAFEQHVKGATDLNGSRTTLANIASINEYPIVLLACSMALYTLATDAAFDIDIISPDGVSIPRSERFRQLMEVVQTKKEQYRELSALLGIGLFGIEVFTLRRISRMTNKYIPVYRPQEIDDRSMPQRVLLTIPTYGDVTPAGPVPVQDLTIYEGDSYSITLDFPFDVTSYTLKSEIRYQSGEPVILATFTITQDLLDNTKVTLSLTKEQTDRLPRRSYWDIQATSVSDPTYQQTYMCGGVFLTRQVTV